MDISQFNSVWENYCGKGISTEQDYTSYSGDTKPRPHTYSKMLENRPEDALGSLVQTVYSVQTVQTLETAETVETVQTALTVQTVETGQTITRN